MERVAYVEVLDRRLRVKERHRFERFPITIGRAYNNDLILDDRFACAHHLRMLAEDDGSFTAEDLGSVNGMRRLRSRETEARIRLSPDTVIRVGHSFLRVRGLSAPVPETATLHGARRQEGLSVRGLLQSTAASLLLFGFFFGFWLLGAFHSNTGRSAATSLFGDALTVLALLLAWSGCWALANRAVQQEFQFAGHLAIATGGVLAFMLLHAASEYWSFLVATGPSLDVMRIAAALAPTCAVLYAHLSLSWSTDGARRLLVAVVVAASLVGVFRVNRYLDERAFSPVVDFPSELKPTSARWLRTVTPEEFFGRAEAMKAELDRSAEERDD